MHMIRDRKVGVVIPALNEEKSIGKVVASVPDWVDDIVVVDNGSTDATAEIAANCGASVVAENEAGYGAACHRGIAHIDDADIIVFVDGDLSDYPEEMHLLVEPIADGHAQLVIGSRTLGTAQRGSLTPQQRFGNAFACFLIHRIWGKKYSDLGPFRAIAVDALKQINMRDRGYGWTVEMQVRAVQEGMAVMEVPVRYRKRIGKSKISGTVKGTVLAGFTIISTIVTAALSGPGRHTRT